MDEDWADYGGCQDVEGHEDAGYEGCQWYVENGQCGEYEDWLPASNCCECGGGSYGDWDDYDDYDYDYDYSS